MSFLFSSQNGFARCRGSASAPLVERGDFKPLFQGAPQYLKGCSDRHLPQNPTFYPCCSIRPTRVVPAHTQEIPTPAQRFLWRNLFLTSFWRPMWRYIINYYEKYMGCTLKSTELMHSASLELEGLCCGHRSSVCRGGCGAGPCASPA